MLIGVLAAAPVAVSVAQKATGVVKGIGDAIGGLFGGGPKDDWAKAASGQVAPPNTSLPTHLYQYLPAEYKSITQVTAAELLEAINTAPMTSTLTIQGIGSFGTAADLRAALTIPNKEAAAHVGSNQALANAAAYAAHGGVEGPTHWSNIPPGEHAVYMIGELRKRKARATAPLGRAEQVLAGAGVSPIELGLAGLSVFLLLKK